MSQRQQKLNNRTTGDGDGDDWTSSFHAWQSDRRGSLQANSSLQNLQIMADVQQLQQLRHQQQVQIRNKGLGQKLRDRAKSLQLMWDNDLSANQRTPRHEVEILLALRNPNGGNDDFDLGLNLTVSQSQSSKSYNEFKISVVRADTPADAGDFRPGDKLLAIDSQFQLPSTVQEVMELLTKSVQGDGVTYVKVKRNLRDSTAVTLPVPPLTTLPDQLQESQNYHSKARQSMPDIYSQQYQTHHSETNCPASSIKLKKILENQELLEFQEAQRNRRLQRRRNLREAAIIDGNSANHRAAMDESS